MEQEHQEETRSLQPDPDDPEKITINLAIPTIYAYRKANLKYSYTWRDILQAGLEHLEGATNRKKRKPYERKKHTKNS